jgi:hypothetical protein
MFWATKCIWMVFRWCRAISGLCVSPVWPVVVTGMTGQRASPVHMLSTGLTGGGDRSDRSELSWCICSVFIKLFACIRPGGVALVQGELACVQGELFVVFKLWFGGLRSLLEHSFVSDVSSRCPYLRGPRLVFFKWSFFAFVWLSITCWSLFLFVIFHFLFSWVTIFVCCQCTHQGGDWGPCVVRGPVDGRFLVWWVIDNVAWTDSRLSIAGAGCGLTGVGAGEGQVWKVVAGEASSCGEDK